MCLAKYNTCDFVFIYVFIKLLWGYSYFLFGFSQQSLLFVLFALLRSKKYYACRVMILFKLFLVWLLKTASQQTLAVAKPNNLYISFKLPYVSLLAAFFCWTRWICCFSKWDALYFQLAFWSYWFLSTEVYKAWLTARKVFSFNCGFWSTKQPSVRLVVLV